MAQFLVTHFNYLAVVILMMTGLFAVFSTGNLVKRLIGLGIFQTSVFLLYISLGKVRGGQPPILPEGHHSEDKGHGAEAGYLAQGASHGAANGSAADAHGAADADAHGAGHGSVQGSVHAAEDAAGHDAAHGAGHAGYGGQEGHEGHGGHEGYEAAAEIIYSNPLPHVLILTAIVVGVATLAVGLALVVRIREAYGSIEDDDIHDADIGREEAGA